MNYVIRTIQAMLFVLSFLVGLNIGSDNSTYANILPGYDDCGTCELSSSIQLEFCNFVKMSDGCAGNNGHECGSVVCWNPPPAL